MVSNLPRLTSVRCRIPKARQSEQSWGVHIMGDPEVSVEESLLRHVAHDYAFGLDLRDGPRFARAFLPDGRLTIIFERAGLEPSETIGQEQLLSTPAKLNIYDRTMHFLGQSHYEIGDSSAEGLVYCLAHHVSFTESGGSDLVMHMSYDDEYARDATGAWRMAHRTGTIHWMETRPVDAPGAFMRSQG